MKSALLSSYSSYGRFVSKPIIQDTQNPSKNVFLSSFCLKQHFSHQKPFISCKFDLPGNKLYLLDTNGLLIQVSLIGDNNFSSLKGKGIMKFVIDGNNSYNLLLTTKNNQLHKLSFENKKTTKIMNLNMNKILVFQRNYLRQMLMLMDYQLLYLYELGTGKTKSLKAKNNEIFSRACFASNNRFIILAIKNIEIRLLDIMDLKTVHSIKLPFKIEDIKIECSYDSKKIAIYGNSPIIFFIKLNEGQLQYEMFEIPFLKEIKALKYTYMNDIVLAGNNQVIYCICPEIDTNKIFTIFNNEHHVRIMNFDISLDCKNLAIVSNRTVFSIKLVNGLRNFLQENVYQGNLKVNDIEYKTKLEMKQENENEFKQEQDIKQEVNKIQYDEEEQQEDSDEDERVRFNFIRNKNQDESVSSLFLDKTMSLPSYKPFPEQSLLQIEFPLDYDRLIGNSSPDSMKKKAHVYYIINQLGTFIPNLIRQYKQNEHQLISLVYQFYKLSGNSAEKCFQISFIILRSIIYETQPQNLQKLCLVLCPQIISIISKRFSIDFFQFFKSQLRKLFINYFNRDNWIKMINYLLKDGKNRIQTLTVLFICVLQMIYEKIYVQEKSQQYWKMLIEPSQKIKQLLNFDAICRRIQTIFNNEKYKYILRSPLQQVSEIREMQNIRQKQKQQSQLMYQNSKLQSLLKKQEAIKMALLDAQRHRPLADHF